jgi:hypothetical protein
MTRFRPRHAFPGLMTTTVQQRQALRLLADAHHGRTVADPLAHGFTKPKLVRRSLSGAENVFMPTVTPIVPT